MGWFFADDEKFVAKDDGVKYKQERSDNGTKYQKIVEDKNSNYHDTYGAFRTNNNNYVEFYHGGNISSSDKKDFGDSINDTITTLKRS